MNIMQIYTKLVHNVIFVVIICLIASCDHNTKQQRIYLWGSPSFLHHADFFMNESGEGAGIKDTVVYVTKDGGKKWDGPISLNGYRYIIYPSSNLRNRYKIYNGTLYFYVVSNDEFFEKRRSKEIPKRHLAKFNLSTYELTVNSEGFSDVDDIFIKESRLYARVEGNNIVECDDSLNISSRSKLPFTCLSLIPTSKGYCTLHPNSVKFIENDLVLTVDFNKSGMTGPIFSSAEGEIFIYRSDTTESAILKISESKVSEEICETFPHGTYIDYFSSGDAFFISTICDNYKSYLVYSLDGGKTWSRRKIPLSIASTCHLAYYDGKLFY